MTVNYKEGDWFSVPLRDGGHAIGLVARASSGGVLLGYFFGPRRMEPPTLGDVRELVPRQAVLVARFGHLGLLRGKWPILGHQDEWSRADWPMPAFVRREELSGRILKVLYDDGDPSRRVREEQIARGTSSDGPKDGMMGAGYVEKVLTLAT